MLNGPSEHCLQKLTNAAEKVFAERALLLDENRLMFQQNNEKEPHQSSRSTVVGKAKVMSYEDIVEAQAKRDAKETAVVKGKPGRKRLASALVAAQAKQTRKSETEVAMQEIEAEGLGNHCSVLQLS